MISAYSLSLPLLSLHLRNMTEASTLAGEKVLGSLSREITLSRMVLMMKEQFVNGEKRRTFYYQILTYERKALHRQTETVVSVITAQTEALVHLFPLVAQLHAAPNPLSFSNTDSAFYLFFLSKMSPAGMLDFKKLQKATSQSCLAL